MGVYIFLALTFGASLVGCLLGHIIYKALF